MKPVTAFATWKLCLSMEIQRALTASFAAKSHSLFTIGKGYLTKIMHVFTLYLPQSCQALCAVGKEASSCLLNS